MMPRQERYVKERQAFVELIKCYPFTPENLEGEQWAPIETEGYIGYEVSNYGRVKSLKVKPAKILKPKLNQSNYLICNLSKNNKSKAFAVHRLVAKAFIPNPDNKPQVNHIDGCKWNSCAMNLEWVTASENRRHAYNIGLQGSGELIYNALLTNEQVLLIRQNPDNLKVKELAEKFAVGVHVISMVQTGKSYRSIGGRIRGKLDQHKVALEDRAQIRAKYRPRDRKRGARALAREYGVDLATIRRIIKGE